jgi:hypothetical protein
MLSFTRLNDRQEASIPFRSLLASERPGDFLFEFRIPDGLLRIIVMKGDVRIRQKHQQGGLMFPTAFLQFPLFRAQEGSLDELFDLLMIVCDDMVAPTGRKRRLPDVGSGFLGG